MGGLELKFIPLFLFFVTLTTIGFGDMVPTKSFLHYKEGVYEAFKMIFTVLYCVFGMTLLSMCVNLMQEQVMDKINWAVNKIGMNDDDAGESNNEIVKITRPEFENRTPKSLTGNEQDFNARRKKSNN
ncbi:unnamed protein product [Lepeophtheirus salmonis]|uniref:(salmon louse) hypothetical protein n=1 Tax=Lepeophtheirus salmonis TaxID=72036 RepID=A0A7R8CS94_LEPSM|nr:unnamed protein product [Lepeophtheirus salmonis]CAF2914006.1 unnamed protein product [Lepeophtheirus salmonis]